MTHDPFDESPIGYVTTDPDWVVQGVNQMLGEWLGRAPDDLVGRPFNELLTIAGRIYHETHYAPMVLHRGRVQEVAADLRRPDADPLPVLLSSRALPDGGPYTTIRTSVVRVEERRRYEDELLEQRRRAEASEDRIRTLQHAGAQLGGTTTPDAIGAILTEALEKVEGVASSSLWIMEAGGMSLREAGTSQRNERRLSIDADHPAAACGRTGVLVVDARIGMLAAPLLIGAETTGVLVAVVPDLDQMEIADRDMVTALANQASQAVERAKDLERNENLQRSAGQDLLGPLQVVLGHASSLQGLLDDRLSTNEREAFSRLVWNAERIHRLVDGFLEVTRLATGRARTHPGTVGLAQVIEAAVAMVQPLADSRAVAVTVTDTTGGKRLDLDADLLAQAVGHLLDDAILVSPRRSRVDVTVVDDGSAVTINVRDAGSITRPHEDTWVQTTGEEPTRRSGLGVAITTGFVTAHGGHLLVEDGGAGGWARIVLPKSRDQSTSATTS